MGCVRSGLEPDISQIRYLISKRTFVSFNSIKMKYDECFMKLLLTVFLSWGLYFLNFVELKALTVWCEAAPCRSTDHTSDLSCVCGSVCLRVCGFNAALRFLTAIVTVSAICSPALLL